MKVALQLELLGCKGTPNINECKKFIHESGTLDNIKFNY